MQRNEVLLPKKPVKTSIQKSTIKCKKTNGNGQTVMDDYMKQKKNVKRNKSLDEQVRTTFLRNLYCIVLNIFSKFSEENIIRRFGRIYENLNG